MSDGAPGPGWWQASDLKWYPPEGQAAAPPPPPAAPPPLSTYGPPPSPYVGANGPAAGTPAAPPPPAWPTAPPAPGTYGQAPGSPPGPPPPAWPAAPPGTRPGGAQGGADIVATVQGIVAKLSIPAWLLYGGLAAAVIGVLCPWVSISVMGMSTSAGDDGPSVGWKFALLLVIGAAGFLAWPIVSPTGSAMLANRLIGLSAAVGVFAVAVAIGFYQVISFSSSDLMKMASGFVTASPGFGLYFCVLAVIASAGGVVMLWINQTKTPGQPPGRYPGQP
jgi:hypothetical protein